MLPCPLSTSEPVGSMFLAQKAYSKTDLFLETMLILQLQIAFKKGRSFYLLLVRKVKGSLTRPRDLSTA